MYTAVIDPSQELTSIVWLNSYGMYVKRFLNICLCQLATVGHEPCSWNKRSLQIGGSYNRE